MAKKLLKNGEFTINDGPFDDRWDSLLNYECPEWFRDAKLGMWAHWGPQAVSGAGDWYARNMYMEGSTQYKYHLEHYGHPSEFGYKDIVSLWKAEKFDPVHLIDLYKKAGAKYFVALAVHHDNYDCWDSAYTKWNSVNSGPEKDIVGMWREATLSAGLKFGVTEHLERSYSWFNTNKGSDKQGPYKDVTYDGNNPEFEDFYFPDHPDNNMAYPSDPPDWWKWQWYARIKDLVDKYRPDFLYTDGAVPFGDVGRKMIANFYNGNISWNNGKLEAVYALKDMREHDKKSGKTHGDYVEGIGVQDMERGVINDINPRPWQTDTCIGGWYYNKFINYKDAEQVIHMLVDIVSKNGNLLLNFPLRPDGTLDDECLDVIEGLTAWMSVNSEAIYETRPWLTFGEGPTKSSGGHFNENKLTYKGNDFRFTQKGDVVYAVMLGYPENGETTIEALVDSSGLKVKSVEMLGIGNVDGWEQSEDGLRIPVPDEKPCDYAWVFKIKLS